MKTIAIIDSPNLFRKSFKTCVQKILVKTKLFEIENYYQLQEIIKKNQIDYLFIDPKNSCETKFDLIVHLREKKVIKKLILVSYNHNVYQEVKDKNISFINYIDACLTKNCVESQVVELLNCLEDNQKYSSPEFFPKKETTYNLTQKETKILEMIIKGYNGNQIANELYISIHTFRTHRKNIMKKIGVKTTTDLILFSLKQGNYSASNFD